MNIADPGAWSAKNRGVGLVVLFAVLSLAVPASLVLAGPLRSNGSPARLVGLLMFVLAVPAFFRLRGAQREVEPVTAGLGVLLGITIVLYGHGLFRGLAPEESAGALRYLIGMVASVGIALFVLAMVRTRADVTVVTSAVVFAATVSALVAVAQSISPFDMAALLRLPLFTVNQVVETSQRGGFARVPGAAGHPIEFSVLMGSVAPLALSLAERERGRSRAFWSVCCALILAATPLSVSRSGIVAVVVGLFVYAFVWTWRQRFTAAVLVVAGLVVYRAVAPGLLGTLRGLFTNASTDSSVTARTNVYPAIYRLIGDNPLLGIGPGTFRPARYFFLDNQLLGTLVGGGVVGLAAVLLLIGTGIAVAQRARLRARSHPDRSLCQAVVAGIAALSVSGLTFDLFSFQQSTFLLFTFLGLAGVMYRLVMESEPLADGSSPRLPLATREAVS